MSVDIVLVEHELPLSQQPHLAYLASLASPESRRTMAKALSAVASVLEGTGEHVRERRSFSEIPWHRLTYAHTAAVRARLLQQYSPATVRLYLSALRGVLYQAWKLGQMSSEDYQRAADLEGVPGEPAPAGRELSCEEIAALMQACQADHTPAGARDAAIMGLLYTCGLRRAEIVSLEMDDYDTMSGRLLIRGRGNKQRTAYVGNGARDALDDWLTIRGYAAGPLFVSINRGGTLGSSLSTQAVYNLLVKRGAEAGVLNFSPHDFRRSFASDLLDKGADIATVSRMMGHANLQTTVRYDRRSAAAKRKTA